MNWKKYGMKKSLKVSFKQNQMESALNQIKR